MVAGSREKLNTPVLYHFSKAWINMFLEYEVKISLEDKNWIVSANIFKHKLVIKVGWEMLKQAHDCFRDCVTCYKSAHL